MSISILFKDDDGKELTPDEATDLSDVYTREEYFNGRLKRVDYYINGAVNWGDYYLDEGEDITDVLESVKNIWGPALIYIDEEVCDKYIARNWELYSGMTLIYRGKSVYDQLGREICDVNFDLHSQKLISINKKYYLESYGSFVDDGYVHAFGTFKFSYEFPGTASEKVRVWINLSGFDHKDYAIDEQKNELTHFLISPIFTWDDHPYYHHGLPILPQAI